MCAHKHGVDECKPLRQSAASICPNHWTEKWDEELAEGRFAGVTKSLQQ